MSYFTPNFEDIVFQEENAAQEGERGLFPSSFLDKYEWNHDYLSPLAMLQGIPLSHLPTVKWGLKVSETVVNVLLNTLEVSVQMSKQQKTDFNDKVTTLQNGINRGTLPFNALRSIVNDITTFGKLDTYGDDRPKDIEDYAKLFQKIALPPVASNYNLDSTFSAMRTAGPNPLLIQRLKESMPHFPLTKAQYRKVMKNDTYQAALKEGRLYVCDYELLTTQQENPVAPHKYLYTPIALFAVDKISGELKPVAIQCQQTPSASNPIYIADSSYDWLIAKTIVETADANYHEAISHLGRTHLYIEPFAVATCRNFSANHAIYKLLMPHFEGTFFINFAAVKTLVAPDGSVDHLLQGTLDSTLKMTVKGLQNFPTNKAFLPHLFAQNGTADLPNYAFKDDSLLYWAAIKEWVSDYLTQNYKYAQNVGEDPALLAWYQDLVSTEGGRVIGLAENGKPIQSFAYLVEVLTLLIYTSSVQHAAVNFPQYDLMSYAPNMPFACYDTFPKPQIRKATAQDYLNILPTMGKAKEQINLTYTLGSMHYTQLGQYESGYFDKKTQQGSLLKFQQEVAEIGKTIQTRNLTRRKYTTLMPSAIPQSINI